VFLICSIGPATAVVWGISQWNRVAEHGGTTFRLPWAPGLGLTFDFRLDGFGLLMLALVSGVGLLIFGYSRWYFADGPRLGRFAAILTVFSGAMLGLIVADNLLALFVFWELTSITSYLLIGFDDDKAAARAAALQAMLITGAGGLFMLAGFVILGQAAGTYSLFEILAAPPAGGSVGVALALVLVGAVTKSAQVPFHSWLPSAMAAPTPVSAYLHSAAMVMAGVYLVARLSPAFAPHHLFWQPALITIGLGTMLLGGYRALRQTDLKLLLAHGTVSQLGFMTALVGAGVPELTFAGAALILAHGVFKAALFMVVGAIDNHRGTRDLRRLHQLSREMPGTFVVATIAVASMVGLPPTLGFLAKESAFEASLGFAPAIAGVVVVGSVITFAYSARFLWGAFSSKPDAVAPETSPGGRASEWPLLVPAGILALSTVVLGLATGVTSRLVQVAARALDSASGGELYLWHGFNVPLAMSGATILAGVLLFAARKHVETWQSRVRPALGSQQVFESSLRGLNRVADRTTGLVQTGSLPAYLGVIFLTAVLLPGWALVGNSLPLALTLDASPLQLAVAGQVAAVGLALAVIRRRFIAVLLLGAVGFGVAVLFLVWGAPDLALTQILVETLTLVIFVLVLRHLPERFEPVRWRAGNGIRALISIVVGLFVTGFALIASQERAGINATAIEYLERSVPEAGGQNVVNVILTDFRAFDTLGEIAVLCVAAMGIASLVLAGRGSEPGELPDER